MNVDDLTAWLALTATPGLGPAKGLALLKAFGNPVTAQRASSQELARWLSSSELADAFRKGPPPALIETTQAWLAQPENRFITLGDADYPSALLTLSQPPLVLYTKGQTRVLQQPGIAMVGSRQATAQGLQHARQFARDFSQQGWSVISGLAQGIDGAAHEGALEGPGSTVAVVGTGLDLVYPAAHRDLAHRIAHHGVLVSEFALGTPAKAHHFPRRNRIISALAKGCLVVEAALKSGSLITAREAAELGREVFAIPGSILSPQSRGCHALIRDGAHLVESANEVLELLPGWVETPSQKTTLNQESDGRIPDWLGFDPVDMDTLCAVSNLTAGEVSAILLELELAGLVASQPGGRYQRLA